MHKKPRVPALYEHMYRTEYESNAYIHSTKMHSIRISYGTCADIGLVRVLSKTRPSRTGARSYYACLSVHARLSIYQHVVQIRHGNEHHGTSGSALLLATWDP